MQLEHVTCAVPVEDPVPCAQVLPAEHVGCSRGRGVASGTRRRGMGEGGESGERGQEGHNAVPTAPSNNWKEKRAPPAGRGGKKRKRENERREPPFAIRCRRHPNVFGKRRHAPQDCQSKGGSPTAGCFAGHADWRGREIKRDKRRGKIEKRDNTERHHIERGRE